MIVTSFTPFPVLLTERLVLRKLSAADAPGIFLLRSDERVNKFIDRPAVTSMEGAQQFVDKIEKGVTNGGWLYWAIALKSTDTLIGTICLWNIETEKAQAEIGYELHPDFQGKGFMQEALVKVITFGFAEVNLSVIAALTKAENQPSVKILRKNKFQLDKNNEFVSKEEAGNLAVYYLLSEDS